MVCIREEMPQPMDETLLIFYLWPARCKARAVALAEALWLLRDLQVRISARGPCSEQGAAFWLLLASEDLEAARLRFSRAGYIAAVDWLEPLFEETKRSRRLRMPQRDTLQWHHRWYRRHRLFEEQPEVLREGAPDRRTFLLETAAGTLRPVTGYRGDGGKFSRRGLSVLDARLLVNLVATEAGSRFLDP